VPVEWTAFQQVDRSDPVQAADLVIVESINKAAEAGERLRTELVIQIDAGSRLLAKVGLAVGCKLFGADFGEHKEGAMLRRFFREANTQRRGSIPVHGTGYFAEAAASALDFLAWVGGWVLILQVLNSKLSLSVITPSGRRMSVMITDDPMLLNTLDPSYKEGTVWLTIPSLGEAVGSLPLPDYVAHITRSILHPGLLAAEAARIDPKTLPPC
jgi:hypothetical protein